MAVSAPDGSFELNGNLNGLREVSLSGILRTTTDSVLSSNGDLTWTLPTTGPVAVGPAGGAYVDLVATNRMLGQSIHQYAGTVGDGVNVLVNLDGLKDGAEYGDVTSGNLGEQVMRMSRSEGTTPEKSSLVVPGLVITDPLAQLPGGRLPANAYTASDTGVVRFNPTALSRSSAPYGALYKLGDGVTPFTIRRRSVNISGDDFQAGFGDTVGSLPSFANRFFSEDRISFQWKYVDAAGQVQVIPEALGAGRYTLSPQIGNTEYSRNYVLTGARSLKINPRPLAVSASSTSGVFLEGSNPYLQYDGQFRGYRPDLLLTYEVIGPDGSRYLNLRLVPAGAYKLAITATGRDAANYAAPASLDYTVLPLKVGFTDVSSGFRYGLNEEACTSGVCEMRPLAQPPWRLTGITASALQQLGSDLRIDLRAVAEGAQGTGSPVDANLPVGRYRLEPLVGGRFASSIDLQSPSVTSLQVKPYLLRLDIDRNLYYGAQNGVSEGGNVYMTPSGRPPVRLAGQSQLNDAALEYILQNGSGAQGSYRANLDAGMYTIVPQISGRGATNYALYPFDSALEIRKAVVGYRIDGGLGQYLMGQGFLGTIDPAQFNMNFPRFSCSQVHGKRKCTKANTGATLRAAQASREVA